MIYSSLLIWTVIPSDIFLAVEVANDTDSIFDISQVWNCEHAFDFKCPKEWSALKNTDNHSIRFCESCNEHVTLCKSPEEFVELGNSGKCVAIPDGMAPVEMNMMMLGRPSQEEVDRLNDQNKKCTDWWKQIIQLAPNFAPKAIAAIRDLISKF